MRPVAFAGRRWVFVVPASGAVDAACVPSRLADVRFDAPSFEEDAGSFEDARFGVERIGASTFDDFDNFDDAPRFEVERFTEPTSGEDAEAWIDARFEVARVEPPCFGEDVDAVAGARLDATAARFDVPVFVDDPDAFA